MTSRLAAIALTMALGAALVVAQQPSAAEPSAAFFDDFNAAHLDRSKWNVIVTGRTVNNEQQAYVDSPDTIELRAVEGAANGALVIRPRFSEGFTTSEGRKYDFVSGRLEGRGKAEFTYGTIAARIEMTAGAGIWPAFWALGTGRWPDTGEIDIMENVGDPSWTSVALHGPGYSGDTPLVRRATLPAGQDITGWHVYSVEWRPDLLVFKVDDTEVYRVTKAMVEAYGRWVYDTPKFLILNVALGGNYPQAVNHAREPYPGLPPATVDSIKSGEVTMSVDWVRVTGQEG
jgi:beta-glucanase (GH16 family)